PLDRGHVRRRSSRDGRLAMERGLRDPRGGARRAGERRQYRGGRGPQARLTGLRPGWRGYSLRGADGTRAGRRPRNGAARRARAVLAEERASAEERRPAAASSVRFGDLVDELDLLMKEASSSAGTLDARDVVRPRWRAMRDAVRALDENPSDERLHDFRIETKRSRYAGELFASVPGSRGARFVRRATALQDALGAQHDAVRA